jgi:DNA-directed RNA polymerase subunit RPC12/RpoP
VFLACPNRCSANRFELWNASVFVDERGRYLEHQTEDMALYRCTECGSPAVDLGDVPAAMEAEREADERLHDYTCPNCEALFAAPAEQNPIVCPECGQTFVVAN